MVLLDGLRLRLHRIGLSHWRPGQTLRSWGVAPLHGESDVLHAPCGPGEALWLGAWLEEGTAGGSVRLTHPASGRTAAISLPGAFQIGTLLDAQSAAHPLAAAEGPLQLELASGGKRSEAVLQLHDFAAWSAVSGRPAPAPLAGPPPLPPRLG